MSQRHIALSQCVEHGIDAARVTCHAVGQHIIGVCSIAQQVGKAQPQIDGAHDRLAVVIFVALGRDGIVSHIHLAAQFTVGCIFHKRDIERRIEGECPSVQPFLGGFGLSHGQDTLGQAGEF